MPEEATRAQPPIGKDTAGSKQSVEELLSEAEQEVVRFSWGGTFADYLVPTSVEVPEPVILHRETPSPFTPLGAKGVGELPIDGPAPAILNAIEDATGVPVYQIPATPEILMKEMEAAGVC